MVTMENRAKVPGFSCEKSKSSFSRPSPSGNIVEKGNCFMDKRINRLQAYLDKARSVYHAVALLTDQLEQAGYVQLAEQDDWQLAPGGKYYVTRGGSALIAFRIPEGDPTGFLMAAAHTDRPTFKLKENGELTGKYTRLATEKYGGMVLSSWMDRPLSIAGRVMVQTDTGITAKLVDVDRDLLVIPSVAIHLNRKVNEGYAWNPTVDTLPLLGGENAAGKLSQQLEELAGGKILGHDLYLYVRQESRLCGIDQEFITAPALDDLMCAWCCTQGFVESKTGSSLPVLCLFDSEEVGSSSVQGACSDLLQSILERICRCCGRQLSQMLRHSFMVSADNAHALHPNHPELSDSTNAPVMNKGIVLKFNANLKYATDGVAAAVLRSVCEKANVPVQTYYNRADLPGGSTLGSLSLAHVAVPTADIGLAQLAMHCACETAGAQDVNYLTQAMKTYFSSTLECTKDGQYTIK